MGTLKKESLPCVSFGDWSSGFTRTPCPPSSFASCIQLWSTQHNQDTATFPSSQKFSHAILHSVVSLLLWYASYYSFAFLAFHWQGLIQYVNFYVWPFFSLRNGFEVYFCCLYGLFILLNCWEIFCCINISWRIYPFT